MIKEVIDSWNKNKYKLEKYFSNTRQEKYQDYIDIVKLVVKYILPDYAYKEIQSVCFGDYQGIEIFIIPESVFSPSMKELIYTHNYYGSCSGCDTLLNINEYETGIPNKEQVEEYMLLCLGLVENMRYFKEKI